MLQKRKSEEIKTHVDFVTINIGAHGAAHPQHGVWGLLDDGTEVAGLALLCRDHERCTAEKVLAATKAMFSPHPLSVLDDGSKSETEVKPTMFGLVVVVPTPI